MLATLQELGVVPSLSRPAVSNDNARSESLFQTLIYRPAYPQYEFQNLLEARKGVAVFTQWYNHEHRHSAIRFVTPAQRMPDTISRCSARGGAICRRADA